jgi:hypothetical protein
MNAFSTAAVMYVSGAGSFSWQQDEEIKEAFIFATIYCDHACTDLNAPCSLCECDNAVAVRACDDNGGDAVCAALGSGSTRCHICRQLEGRVRCAGWCAALPEPDAANATKFLSGLFHACGPPKL